MRGVTRQIVIYDGRLRWAVEYARDIIDLRDLVDLGDIKRAVVKSDAIRRFSPFAIVLTSFFPFLSVIA